MTNLSKNYNQTNSLFETIESIDSILDDNSYENTQELFRVLTSA